MHMTFDSASDLARALRRAADAHGQHEEQLGRPDPDWPDWYALYMEREQAGRVDQAEEGSAMDETAARQMIKDHFDASNISVAGGGPGDEIARASEIYADDAVLEWPQGGERIRGKANIIAFRSAYPARQDFQLHRTIGCQNLWVNEYTIRYDERPLRVVGIMEFRDGKVVRERIYFGEPWEPPAWRAQWVERMDPEA
jgi:SnoaL-like domain